MTASLAYQKAFRERVRRGDPVIGLFVKTPCMQTVEIIATTGLDFLILDLEHAAFSTANLDTCLLAARAARLPALVRLGNTSSDEVTRCLDLGAAGIVFPHVKSRDEALAHIRKTRYAGGERGFSASHRAAGFGTEDPWKYVEQSDSAILAIAQIEDIESVAVIDEIAGVGELDALFIGPADLELSLRSAGDEETTVEQSIRQICEAGRVANKTVGIFQPSMSQVPHCLESGIRFFVVSTDQALLRAASENLSNEFESMTRPRADV